MKQLRLSVEQTVKQLVKHIVEQEVYEWPPRCAVLYYQPVRPPKKRETGLSKEQCVEER